MKPVIILTMGDPGGIGPEVVAKTLAGRKLRREFLYLLVGAKSVFDFLSQKKVAHLALHPVLSASVDSLRANAVNFFDISDLPVRQAGEAGLILNRPAARQGAGAFDIGKISRRNALLAYAALAFAAAQAARGMAAALVTAPVNKTAMRLIDPGFHGHTEFLARASGAKKFAMMFVSDRLKVTLVTIHVALKKVSGLIRQENIFEKIKLTDRFLKKYYGIRRPCLAVCALNPHGPETGREDLAKILPAVARARAAKIDAVGPLSADQVFHEAYQGRFDAVISMYHDQGLAPFKMIAFREGVNTTLGLPFIRTSPDHGTAFDIAYRGKADPASFASALAYAEKFLRQKN